MLLAEGVCFSRPAPVPPSYQDLYESLEQSFDTSHCSKLVRQEFDALQAPGVNAVPICIGFAVPYRPFYKFDQNTEDHQHFLSVYRELKRISMFEV